MHPLGEKEQQVIYGIDLKAIANRRLQYGTDKLTQKLNFLRGLYDIPIKAFIKPNPLYADLLKAKDK